MHWHSRSDPVRVIDNLPELILAWQRDPLLLQKMLSKTLQRKDIENVSLVVRYRFFYSISVKVFTGYLSQVSYTLELMLPFPQKTSDFAGYSSFFQIILLKKKQKNCEAIIRTTKLHKNDIHNGLFRVVTNRRS